MDFPIPPSSWWSTDTVLTYEFHSALVHYNHRCIWASFTSDEWQQLRANISVAGLAKNRETDQMVRDDMTEEG